MPATDIPSLLPPGSYYLSGNEALAEGALAAGCRYYAGYPITPSSELMERMAVRLPELGGVFIQMEDEIASVCSLIGAAWAGAKAMTATSGPGFSLMQEAIGYAAFTETPLVIADIQRAGPCTGQATRVGSGDWMQAKWGSHGDYQVIALAPWSVQEMYTMAVEAFNLAERYRVPVFVMGEEAVAHLREKMDIPSPTRVFERLKVPGAAPFSPEPVDGVPPMPAFGDGERLLVTGSTHDAAGIRRTDDPLTHARLVAHINHKILDRRRDIAATEAYFLEDAELLVAAYGFTARSALFAVRQLRREGLKVGLLRLKVVWPFPDFRFSDLPPAIKSIFVPEMNLGQVAGEIRRHVACDVHGYQQTDGDVIPPGAILARLREVLR